MPTPTHSLLQMMPTSAYLYVVASPYTNAQGCKKLGLTYYPHQRLRNYRTGDAPGCGLEKYFEGLWQVTARTTSELHQREAQLHSAFAQQRLSWSDGTLSEWFRVDFQAVEAFMSQQPWVIHRLTLEEVEEVHTRSRRPETTPNDQQEIARESVIAAQASAAPPPPPQLHPSFAALLPAGHLFRKPQQELWDSFTELVASPATDIRKIVQWATGVGKTMAILIMFHIAFMSHRGPGPFRALLIAPTVEILQMLSRKLRTLFPASAPTPLQILEGHSGELRGMKVPESSPFVVLATHQGLATLNRATELAAILPALDWILYDEVHRITGAKLAEMLATLLPFWRPRYLLGTSATPLTSRTDQHRAILSLFGGDWSAARLSICDYATAIQEGYIAKPRMSLHLVPANDRIPSIMTILRNTIAIRREQGYFRGGKMILYLKDLAQIEDAARILRTTAAAPEFTVYTANEFQSSDLRDTSNEFCAAPADGSPRLLLACHKFREGSDISGLDLTAVAGQKDIQPYILLQIAGRALRRDYPEKVGDCLIFRDAESTESPESILENVFGQLVVDVASSSERSTLSASGLPDATAIAAAAQLFGISSSDFSVYRASTVLQRLFERRAWSTGDLGYSDLVRAVRSEGIRSEAAYSAAVALSRGWPADPTSLPQFRSWYDLLFAQKPVDQRISLTELREAVAAAGIQSRAGYEAASNRQPNLFPPWEHLTLGLLRDERSPMSSHLEQTLFGESSANQRTSRRKRDV